MLKFRLLSGEIPEPHSLVCIYVVALLVTELGPQKGTDKMPVVQGSETSVIKVFAVWAACFALIRARRLEPKVISSRLVAQLAVAYGLNTWCWELIHAMPGGRDVSKLFTPFASVVTAIIQKRFFHTGGDEDLAGVMLLCFAFVTLTATQLALVHARQEDVAPGITNVIWSSLSSHSISAFFSFTLWLRARQSRLNPVQALQRSSTMALPCMIAAYSLSSLLPSPSTELMSTASVATMMPPPTASTTDVETAASGNMRRLLAAAGQHDAMAGGVGTHVSSPMTPEQGDALRRVQQRGGGVIGDGAWATTAAAAVTTKTVADGEVVNNKAEHASLSAKSATALPSDLGRGEEGGGVDGGFFVGGAETKHVDELPVGRRAMLEGGGGGWHQEGLVRVDAPGLAKLTEGSAAARLQEAPMAGMTSAVANSSAISKPTVVREEEVLGGGGGEVLGYRVFSMVLWGVMGAVVDLLTFVVVIYGGPAMLQVGNCLEMCAWTIISVSISPEDELSSISRAMCTAGALAGAYILVTYMKRWNLGWGTMPVPVPTLSMNSVIELEQSFSRQLGSEMGKITSQATAERRSSELPPESPGIPQDDAKLGTDNPPQFVGGALLTDAEKETIWSWLPYRQQIRHASLIYSGEQHGYNLHSLYRMCEQAARPHEHKRGIETACIMVIKTAHRELLGCYTSTHWHRQDAYYGNGECFVYRLRPRPQRFRWSKANTMMMLGGVRSLTIGSGSEPAIWLDDELSYGLTASCDTFKNTPLVSCEGPSALPPKDEKNSEKYDKIHEAPGRNQAVFRCVAIEVYMLE